MGVKRARAGRRVVGDSSVEVGREFIVSFNALCVEIVMLLLVANLMGA